MADAGDLDIFGGPWSAGAGKSVGVVGAEAGVEDVAAVG